MTQTNTDKTVSTERLAEAMKRCQEALDLHNAEVADQLASEGERADLWTDIEVLVDDLRTILASLASRHQEPVNESAENVDRVDYDKWQFLNDTIDRCRRDAAEATAKLETAEAERDALRKALEPFADAVFNDNGDMTVNLAAPTSEDFINAYFALRAARAALEASQ